jgi:hypothetical protein
MTIYCTDGNARSNVTRVQRCVTQGTLSTRVNARLEFSSGEMQYFILFASALIASLMSSNRLSKDLIDILK